MSDWTSPLFSGVSLASSATLYSSGSSSSCDCGIEFIICYLPLCLCILRTLPEIGRRQIRKWMHLWLGLLRSGKNAARPAADGTGRKRLSNDSKASGAAARHPVRACCQVTRFWPEGWVHLVIHLNKLLLCVIKQRGFNIIPERRTVERRIAPWRLGGIEEPICVMWANQ